MTAAPPKKKNADRLRSIAERYRNHPRYILFGFEFYLSGIYSAGEDAGRPIFQNRGGAIGRIPIAPVFMRTAQGLFFGETWRGLLLEREAVNRFGKVEFGQGTVRLVPLQ